MEERSNSECRTAVRVCHLTKRFGRETVLHDVHQDFEAGKIYGLVGFNGSGKSVLLKCICGFLQPTEGYVEVNGKRIGQEIDFPENLGSLIEAPGFLEQYSGYQNLRMLAALKGRISKEDIKATLDLVQLPVDKKPVGQYSLGMKQRLGIAQAIMEDPDVLILDEPFNGLDKKMVDIIRRVIRSLKNEKRIIFLVSHNALDIQMLCDEIYEIDAGVLRKIEKVDFSESM